VTRRSRRRLRAFWSWDCPCHPQGFNHCLPPVRLKTISNGVLQRTMKLTWFATYSSGRQAGWFARSFRVLANGHISRTPGNMYQICRDLCAACVGRVRDSDALGLAGVSMQVEFDQFSEAAHALTRRIRARLSASDIHSINDLLSSRRSRPSE
jgi:hypothetical protein